MRSKAIVVVLGLMCASAALVAQPGNPTPGYPPSAPQTGPPGDAPGMPPAGGPPPITLRTPPPPPGSPGVPPNVDPPVLGSPGDEPGAVPDPGQDPSADAAVDPSTFYQPLSQYGEWAQDPSYGSVWEPSNMPAGWRPYTDGHWVYTDAGWAWAGDEPWAWAAYRYGRWYQDPSYGWRWVPGADWAPAWVAWQEGDGYIGWAPLPPTVGFSFSAGLALGGVDLGVSLSPWSFCFVAERDLLAPRIAVVALPAARNVTLVRETRNITHYAVVGHRVVNQGLTVRQVEQATGRRIQPVRVGQAATAGVARENGGQIAFYRPRPSPIARSSEAPAGRVAPPLASRNETAEQMTARHTRERAGLEQYQTQERQRLQQYHQTEAPNSRVDSGALAQRHAAEVQAMQEQHQREQQQLSARQERERQTVQQRPNRPPAHEPQRPPSR